MQFHSGNELSCSKLDLRIWKSVSHSRVLIFMEVNFSRVFHFLNICVQTLCVNITREALCTSNYVMILENICKMSTFAFCDVGAWDVWTQSDLKCIMWAHLPPFNISIL